MPEIAQSKTLHFKPPKATRNLSPNGLHKKARRQSGETTILTDEDWTAPLPPRYRTMLETGTAPDLLLSELFNQWLELRHLLEAVVISWPLEIGNQEIVRAETFLQSHCASCGECTNLADIGNLPVCRICDSE